MNEVAFFVSCFHINGLSIFVESNFLDFFVFFNEKKLIVVLVCKARRFHFF